MDTFIKTGIVATVLTCLLSAGITLFAEVSTPVDRLLQFTSSESAPDQEISRVGGHRLDELIGTLNGRNVAQRVNAARLLGTAADGRAVEPLIAALNGKSGLVRGHAAAALGAIGDYRALEPLTEALEDDEAFVRSQAATALGQLGDCRPLEALISALRDSDPGVQCHVAKALGMIKDKRAVVPLSAMLEQEVDLEVLLEAVRALGGYELLDWSLHSLQEVHLITLGLQAGFGLDRGMRFTAHHRGDPNQAEN